MYTAAKGLPINVQKILGQKEQFIAGKGAEKMGGGTFGTFTTFLSGSEVYFPFKE